MTDQDTTISQLALQQEQQRSAAIFAAVHRYLDISVQFHLAMQKEAQGNALIEEAKQIKKKVNDQYAKLLAMAELFCFDLKEEYKKHDDRQRQLPAVDVTRRSEIGDLTATASAIDKPKSIKDHVIETAQEAYPHPIRASALRHQLATMGIATHDKTIGMTMYRLLRDGTLRRDGRDWFYVPSPRRHDAADQRGDGSGDEPVLQLEEAAD